MVWSLCYDMFVLLQIVEIIETGNLPRHQFCHCKYSGYEKSFWKPQSSFDELQSIQWPHRD